MNLTPTSDFDVFLLNLMPILAQAWAWLIYLFAIGICILGFIRTKKKAYFAILIFFLHPLFNWSMTKVQYAIHKEEYQIMAEQERKAFEEKIERGEVIMLSETNINIPMFETFLVLGLFYVCKRELKGVNRTVKNNLLNDN